jgi:hypothetical protein
MENKNETVESILKKANYLLIVLTAIIVIAIFVLILILNTL